MGTQKLPVPVDDLHHYEREIMKLKGTRKEWVLKCYLLFRYQGIHVSRVISAESELKEIEAPDGRIRLGWYRTMKGQNPSKAKAWTTMKKHRLIYFNVDDFYKTMKKQYGSNIHSGRTQITRNIKRFGEKLEPKVFDVTPNALRHNLAVGLLEKGFSEMEVCQILNCSLSTLRDWYGKKPQKTLDDKLEKVGW